MKTVGEKVSVEKETSVGKEIISPEDVMAPLGGEKGYVRLELSPVKRAGVWLAGWVLALIATISVVLVGAWVAVTIIAPSQSGTVLDGSIRLFETIVPKLLPLLTLLIGYLFGRGEQASKEH